MHIWETETYTIGRYNIQNWAKLYSGKHTKGEKIVIKISTYSIT